MFLKVITWVKKVKISLKIKKEVLKGLYDTNREGINRVYKSKRFGKF